MPIIYINQKIRKERDNKILPFLTNLTKGDRFYTRKSFHLLEELQQSISKIICLTEEQQKQMIDQNFNIRLSLTNIPLKSNSTSPIPPPDSA